MKPGSEHGTAVCPSVLNPNRIGCQGFRDIRFERGENKGSDRSSLNHRRYSRHGLSISSCEVVNFVLAVMALAFVPVRSFVPVLCACTICMHNTPNCVTIHSKHLSMTRITKKKTYKYRQAGRTSSRLAKRLWGFARSYGDVQEAMLLQSLEQNLTDLFSCIAC
jgi:hypothetical protein